MKFLIMIFIFIFCSLSESNAQTKFSKINPDSLNTEFLETLINNKIDSLRVLKKLQKLVWNDTLEQAIDDQVQYVAEKKQITHYQTGNPKKYSVSDRLKLLSIENVYCGENLAYTYIYTSIKNKNGKSYINTTYEETASDFIMSWVKSAVHYKNITSKEYTLTAISVSYDKDLKIVYAGQIFSSKEYK